MNKICQRIVFVWDICLLCSCIACWVLHHWGPDADDLFYAAWSVANLIIGCQLLSTIMILKYTRGENGDDGMAGPPGPMGARGESTAPQETIIYCGDDQALIDALHEAYAKTFGAPQSADGLLSDEETADE